MCRAISCAAVALLVAVLATGVSFAGTPPTDGIMDFDGGGDGTSWDDNLNWELVADPDGTPNSGDPATPPTFQHSANISLLGVVIDNTMVGLAANRVTVGTTAGAGSLDMSGGDITLNDDIDVGGPGAGTMTLSGGTATTGDDVDVGTDGVFNITGGNLNVGDRINLSGNAILNVNGGDVFADDDFFFFENSQTTLDSGSMIVNDKFRMDDAGATTVINGGFLRANEFGLEGNPGEINFAGTVEINGTGLLQIEQPSGPGSPPSQLTRARAFELINAGTIFTSEASPLQLGVTTVIVPLFDGRPDVAFTQIAVVPEPGTLALVSLAGLCLAARRRRA